MEKLIVLGTGNAQAVHCYNTCFAMQKGEEYFLTDAGGGNGILLALEKQNIPLEKIHHIFVPMPTTTTFSAWSGSSGWSPPA
mgnify:CR=1 FL=1